MYCITVSQRWPAAASGVTVWRWQRICSRHNTASGWVRLAATFRHSGLAAALGIIMNLRLRRFSCVVSGAPRRSAKVQELLKNDLQKFFKILLVTNSLFTKCLFTKKSRPLFSSTPLLHDVVLNARWRRPARESCNFTRVFPHRLLLPLRLHQASQHRLQPIPALTSQHARQYIFVKTEY